MGQWYDTHLLLLTVNSLHNIKNAIINAYSD